VLPHLAPPPPPPLRPARRTACIRHRVSPFPCCRCLPRSRLAPPRPPGFPAPLCRGARAALKKRPPVPATYLRCASGPPPSLRNSRRPPKLRRKSKGGNPLPSLVASLAGYRALDQGHPRRSDSPPRSAVVLDDRYLTPWTGSPFEPSCPSGGSDRELPRPPFFRPRAEPRTAPPFAPRSARRFQPPTPAPASITASDLSPDRPPKPRPPNEARPTAAPRTPRPYTAPGLPPAASRPHPPQPPPDPTESAHDTPPGPTPAAPPNTTPPTTAAAQTRRTPAETACLYKRPPKKRTSPPPTSPTPYTEA
jgi:hypothetical protein